MSDEAKIRIESDGTPIGTKVFVVHPDGAESLLKDVSCVGWELDSRDGSAVAKLKCHHVSMSVIGYGKGSSMAVRKSRIPGGWVKLRSRIH